MIEISARLKPFSHQVGTSCMLPGTPVQVQVFPTRLCFLNMLTGKKWEEKLAWKGPVEGFTVEMDLERGEVRVFGQTADGFRSHLIGSGQVKKRIEVLSLGKHTKLDWQQVVRRMSVEEMLPVLFLLGQQVPSSQATTSILKLLEFSDKREIVKQLKNFFRVGFQGILVPRLVDEEFQGIVEEGEVEGSPLALLSEGYLATRALFFQEKEDGWALLPLLPPEFHAGRLIYLFTSRGDEVSLEWSKKMLKRVVIKPASSRSVYLLLSKPLSSCRINRKVRQDLETPLQLEKGKTLFLDRFEK